MALLFMDSFDHYTRADIQRKWDVGAGTLGTHFDLFQDLTAPGGGNCLRMPANTGGTTPFLSWSKPGGTASTVIAGCWFYLEGMFANGGPKVFAVGDYGAQGQTGATHAAVQITNNGFMQFCRGDQGGTVLATATSPLKIGTWYHIEMKVKVDSSVGTYEVRVNGSSTNGLGIPAATGQNTRNGGTNAYVNGISLINYQNQQITRIKGVYLLDTSGTTANDFIGPCRVTVLRPGGSGAHSDFTGIGGTNYGAVDEMFMDQEVSYSVASAASSVDTFLVDDIPSATTATVVALQHVIGLKQEPGAARTVAGVSRISSTDYAGTTKNTPTSYRFITDPMSVSPATSAAWTVAEVNSAQFGYKVVA